MNSGSFVHFLLTGRTVLEGMSILLSVSLQVLLHLQLLYDPLATHSTIAQASLYRRMPCFHVPSQAAKPQGFEAAVLVRAREDLLFVIHMDMSADVLRIR